LIVADMLAGALLALWRLVFAFSSLLLAGAGNAVAPKRMDDVPPPPTASPLGHATPIIQDEGGMWRWRRKWERAFLLAAAARSEKGRCDRKEKPLPWL
jgi:hypothetical protein